MSDWLSAGLGLVGGLTDLVGSGFGIGSYFETKANNEWQRQFSEKQFQYQAEQNEIQRQREDTAIQRRKADLEAAGLNPLLAVGQAGTSMPAATGGSASAGGATPKAGDIGFKNVGALIDAVKQSAGIKQVEEQTNLLKGEASEAKARAELAWLDVQDRQSALDEGGERLNQFRLQQEYVLARTDAERQRIAESQAEVLLKGIQGKKISADQAIAQAREARDKASFPDEIAKQKATTALLDYEAAVRKAEVEENQKSGVTQQTRSTLIRTVGAFFSSIFRR